MERGKVKRNAVLGLISILCGIMNAMLGTGAGMVLIIVMTLMYSKTEDRDIFASVSFVVLGLCIVSAIMYKINGNLDISASWIYAVPGAIGGLIGALMLSKIKARHLRFLLAGIMMFCGVRILMR